MSFHSVYINLVSLKKCSNFNQNYFLEIYFALIFDLSCICYFILEIFTFSLPYNPHESYLPTSFLFFYKNWVISTQIKLVLNQNVSLINKILIYFIHLIILCKLIFKCFNLFYLINSKNKYYLSQ